MILVVIAYQVSEIIKMQQLGCIVVYAMRQVSFLSTKMSLNLLIPTFQMCKVLLKMVFGEDHRYLSQT